MEQTLKCNTLKCRADLIDRALVTTCSHIFCVDCWAIFGSGANNHENYASCPACGTQLIHPDDAVITKLTPTEDYKTSVLSGLSPSIIMECASRALSFWAYQTGQEV
jgi:E3 ubiquitin-protein ligase CCNP1IP1